MPALERIKKENDIKNLTKKEVEALPGEIRDFLVENVSKTGGHLAPNLGTVELTIALHLFLTFPDDKLIWDVGHQSYTHKLLTGRKDGFASLRQHGGISGFPKRAESECDCYDTGHSSTSISAGLGFAKARDLLGLDYRVVSVIGDGALTGGLSFEGLDAAASLGSNFIIVLNDNNMSISPSVGGLARHLTRLRTANTYQDFKESVRNSLDMTPGGRAMHGRISRAKSSIKQLLIPGMIFENLGLTYLGPVDGHNIYEILEMLRQASKIKGAVIVHVKTKKGKGYAPAEHHPDKFHGVAPFDVKTGEPICEKSEPDYSDVLSHVLCREAKKDDRLVAITAAMADGTGLKNFSKLYPNRFFDVGIAEAHAATFAAGMACAGMTPVVAIYSTFLQRAYDEIMMDVCLQRQHVIFAVDRAGLVGADGETHQGIFDISYLAAMPNMVVMAPKNRWEFAAMLRYAIRSLDCPVAIRYPRGTSCADFKGKNTTLRLGKSEIIENGSDAAIFAVGAMIPECAHAASILKERGISCTLVNARFIKPLDEELVTWAAKEHRLLVSAEENVLVGGYGSLIERSLGKSGTDVPLLMIGVDDMFVPHGDVRILRKELGMDAESIADRIEEKLKCLR